jgi:predicted aspartyl protease
LPQQPSADPDVVAIGTDAVDRMTVPVTVAGSGPFPFVIDTGAERTVISRELAGQLELKPGGVVQLHSMSGVSPVHTVMIPKLGVSTDTIRKIQAPALSKENIGASGILGIDSLKEQQVVLDFKAGTMAVSPSERTPFRHYTTKSWNREANDPDLIVVKARSRFGQLILTDAYANGHRIDVIVDTGSQISVGNKALQRMIWSEAPKNPVFPVELISVTGDTIAAQLTTIDTVEIGGMRLEGMKVAFADVHPFRKFHLLKKPALLLGIDTLRAFDKVSVDFAKREIRFIIPGGARNDTGQQFAMAGR